MEIHFGSLPIFLEYIISELLALISNPLPIQYIQNLVARTQQISLFQFFQADFFVHSVYTQSI